MSSTSLSGANLVDGLPPVSSENTFGEHYFTKVGHYDLENEDETTRETLNVSINSTEAVNRQPGFRLKDS